MKRKPLQLKLPTSYELILSPQGDRMAAIGKINVVTVDTVKMQRLMFCHPLSHPAHACFNVDGSSLAVKNTKGRIVLVNPVTGVTEVDFKNADDRDGSNIAFSPDGSWLVDGSWDGKIHVHDVRTGAIEQVFSYAGEMIEELSCCANAQIWTFLHQPTVSPGENFCDAPYISVWNWPLASPRIIELSFDNVDAAVISPDGEWLAVSGYCRSQQQTFFRLLDLAGRCVQELAIDRCKGLRWSPCGTVIGRIGGQEIAVHLATNLAQSKTFSLQYPSAVAFAPDLSYIALGSWTGGVVQPFDPLMS
jgi:WD40 repeat protein